MTTARHEERIRQLEAVLRDDIAWINSGMCPECGVEMAPDHDAEAGGGDGYANEDCCKGVRERRTAMQIALASGPVTDAPKAPEKIP